LLEPEVDYKTLIQAMDRVRSADVVQFTEVETVELFPNVSIGDAPVLEEVSAKPVSEASSIRDASAKEAIAK
jgi:hypothetical protein